MSHQPLSEARTPPIEDKSWLAHTECLAALTALMRFAAGERNVDAGEAMELAANAIRKTVAALEDFNL